MKKLILILFVFSIFAGCVPEINNEVLLLAEKEGKGFYISSSLWGNIGYDPFYLTTIKETPLDVWSEIKKLNFSYIRCHNLLSDGEWGGNVYSEDEDKNSVYDFSRVDEVIDRFLDVGLKPILEMDFMPDALAYGEIVRNYSGGAINWPSDYDKWWNLIYTLTNHLVKRYGIDEVKDWYFEIWNEPDLDKYYIGGGARNKELNKEGLMNFFKMYDYFADAVKSVDSELKVGGPGIAGREDFLKRFLEHVARERNYKTGEIGSPIDFISWHTYGNIDGILKKNIRINEIINGYPELKDKERLEDEWGPSITREREREMYTTSSEYFPAFLVKMIDGLIYNKDARPTLFLKWGRPINGWRPFFIEIRGYKFKLPIYFGYEVLKNIEGEAFSLKGTDFGDELHGFFISNEDELWVVVYNFNENWREKASNKKVKLFLKDLPSDKFKLTEYLIDDSHSNIRYVLSEMGKKVKDLTEEELKILKKKNVCFKIEREVSAVNKELTLSFEMNGDSMRVFHFVGIGE